MPTTKPRLMFAVDPAIAADLAAIARFRSLPVSRVVSDAVADLGPVFRETALAIQALEAADRKAGELAAKYTGDLKRKFAPHVEQIEQATRDAESALQRIEAARPKRKPAPDSAPREARTGRPAPKGALTTGKSPGAAPGVPGVPLAAILTRKDGWRPL